MERGSDMKHPENAGHAEGVDGAGLRERVAEKTRGTVARAKDGLAAGASGVAEFTKTAASGTKEKAAQVVDFVREAEPDAQLKASVSGGTERTVDRASEALVGAAPTIGRGAEKAAEKLGEALHAIAHPLAVVLGAIAGTLGGWWNKAAELRLDLPREEEEACRVHFTSAASATPDMTFDRARTGYALGYVASRNPGYHGRSFDEVEPELRSGFGDDRAADYEALREFARYGYGRGTGTGAY